MPHSQKGLGLWHVRRRLTNVYAILGEEGAASSEVDTTADSVTSGEWRAVMLADVLRREAVAIVTVITPRVGLPARWS